MKSALVLALAGSAVAAPSFGDFLDALFGGGNNNNDNDSRPRPTDFPGLPPFGTGSGVPFPFPTATGQPFPTGTDGVQPFPYPSSESQAKRQDKPLYVDYQLAAKAAPVVKKRELKYRQLDGSALPSFSLLNPSDTPTATEPATGLPTELPTELPSGIPGLPTELPSGIPTDLPGLPTGFPSAPFPFPTGFPGGEAPTGNSPFPTDAPFPTAPAGTGAPGFPGLPTTLGTVTRGPRPTAAPEQDAGEEEETENGNGWLSWISDLLAGGKGGN